MSATPANPRYSARTALLLLACTALASCSSLSGISNSGANPINWITPYKVDVIQGNFVSKEQVEQLKVGMKLLNALEDFKGAPSPGADAALREGFGILLRCLYPATPHLAHALWSQLGYAAQLGDLLDAPWPEVDASALQQDEIELVLQINGKLRGAVTVPAGADKAAIEAAALASEAFTKQAAGAPAKKVIVVPGRLVNIVV